MYIYVPILSPLLTREYSQWLHTLGLTIFCICCKVRLLISRALMTFNGQHTTLLRPYSEPDSIQTNKSILRVERTCRDLEVLYPEIQDHALPYLLTSFLLTFYFASDQYHRLYNGVTNMGAQNLDIYCGDRWLGATNDRGGFVLNPDGTISM